MPYRLGSLVLAFAVATVTALGAFAGMLWGFALKCDDSCGAGPRWRGDASAWQWSALGWVGIGAFVGSMFFVYGVARRRRGTASLALAVWAVFAGAFLTLLSDSGLTSHPGRGWLGLATVMLIGAAAIRLSAPRLNRAH